MSDMSVALLNRKRDLLAAALLCIALLTLTSCSGDRSCENTRKPAKETPTAFHANNDIAMLLSSMNDALRVGEPLDSSAYNFSGVLTDGSGAPLYIDTLHNPGLWEVRVTSPVSAVVRNVREGDLVAEDLMIYVLDCMKLKDADRLGDSRTETVERVMYRLPKGMMTFEGHGRAGLSGCHIAILLTGNKNTASLN